MSGAITADWKVSDVLRQHPALLQVLIDQSPAFKHLRNPIARSVQTRLVSVGQAARIGGLDPSALVHTLNRAAGLVLDAEPVDVAGQEPPLAAVDVAGPIAEELDVRPLLERGEEPFGAIMAAARRVPLGAALRLRASFEPVPLYEVLGRRGFAVAGRQLAPDDWEIVFTHHGAAADDGEVAAAPVVPEEVNEDDNVVHLDVRGLEPPEPMVRILEAARSLEVHQLLVVEHHRRPMYLYPQLDARGLAHETHELGPGHVRLVIRRADRGQP